MMTDVFTWRNVQYDVTIKKGETRRLLDDVSGFVAPGKLTALMGESGAGKVRESRVYMRRSRADIYLSLDYVAECSGSASSGWCCPWRETRERISSAQRLPGTDVSLGVFVNTFWCLYVGCSGYVQQMDTHMAQATVREALLFSAKLRQPPSVPAKEKEA
jgi:ATP-binding cassette, subfamily G (WHITE), member 2, SNQ2